MIPPEVLAVGGQLVAAGGTVGLLFVGRWLLKAQAVAGAFKIGGILAILLGILATTGVVDVHVGVAIDGIQWLLEVAR